MDQESGSALFTQINSGYNLQIDFTSHKICMKTQEHNLSTNWTNFA